MEKESYLFDPLHLVLSCVWSGLVWCGLVWSVTSLHLLVNQGRVTRLHGHTGHCPPLPLVNIPPDTLFSLVEICTWRTLTF